MTGRQVNETVGLGITYHQVIQLWHKVDGAWLLEANAASAQTKQPADKAEVYGQLNLKLVYRPQEQTMRAEAHLNALSSENGLCPRGDLNPHALCGH